MNKPENQKNQFKRFKRTTPVFGACLFKLLLCLLFLVKSNSVYSQDNKEYDYSTGQPMPNEQNQTTVNPNESTRNFPLMMFEASLGAGFSVGYELREVFEYGNGLELGFSFNLLSNNKLSVAPVFHLNFLNNYYDIDTQDNLIWWGFGAKSNYYLLDRNKGIWNFYPSVSVRYNRINNYVSPRPGFAGNSITVMKGGGLSYSLGFGIVRKSNYLQFDYQFFNPVTKIDKDLINDFNTTSGLYEPYQFNKTRMNFSYIGLTLGMQMPLGKNR